MRLFNRSSFDLCMFISMNRAIRVAFAKVFLVQDLFKRSIGVKRPILRM
jgi:hypothetical protein